MKLLLDRGSISVAGDRVMWLETMLRATPAREAPLTHDVAIRSQGLMLTHADPADRFLAATAQAHDLVLVTADDRLLKCSEIETMPNR